MGKWQCALWMLSGMGIFVGCSMFWEVYSAADSSTYTFPPLQGTYSWNRNISRLTLWARGCFFFFVYFAWNSWPSKVSRKLYARTLHCSPGPWPFHFTTYSHFLFLSCKVRITLTIYVGCQSVASGVVAGT